MSHLQRAIELAVQFHSGQMREGDQPLPYITHPLEVLLNLRFVGRVTDEEMLCAAVLHDTVEAAIIDLDTIQREFGTRVRDLVQELTREEPKPSALVGLRKKEIWRLRAEMLIDEIAKMSSDAQQIKLADRLANLRDAYRTKSGSKLERYKWQTQRILEVVPRASNKKLWDAIRGELAEFGE